MKVALVHDDLVQWGGAERVLLAISEIFPDAPIYTSLYDDKNPLLKKHFNSKKIISSFLQKIPLWKDLYHTFLPLYPLAFEQFDLSEFDLVISQTTRFAKSIITKPETTHICYCHTPPRFLWNYSDQKLNKLLNPLISYLRIFDQISASRVDRFLAGSQNAKSRIKKVYQVDSEVIYPFVDDLFFLSEESFDGGYFLIISRLNRYKKIDLAIQVFNSNRLALKIIGVGPELNNLQLKAKKNIEFLGQVTDEVLLYFLKGSSGLIVLAEEDFGLTSIEAQALGKGVLAYGIGGARETIIENKTGIFFNEQSVDSLKLGLEKFMKLKINKKDCLENANRFTKSKFKNKFKEMIEGTVATS